MEPVHQSDFLMLLGVIMGMLLIFKYVYISLILSNCVRVIYSVNV
jgi:hypothetical protein